MLGRTIVNKSLFLLIVLSLMLAACGGESPAATTETRTGTETEPTDVAQVTPTEPVAESTEPMAGMTATAPMAGETATTMPQMTATAPVAGETATAMPEMTATVGTEETAGATATGGTDTAGTGPGAGGLATIPQDLTGRIQIDGSSTVGPISAAAAEDFNSRARGVRISVGESGTGGGFERFCAENGTDIQDASRPIEQDEIEACEQAGVEFIEIPVAYDGITVVVNRENDWATCLTTQELQTMWGPDAEDEVTNWNQIRPQFPDQELELYGPGEASGTFDFFAEEVADPEADEPTTRADYTPNENDNVLVNGVANGGPGALGYFGYAYYAANQNRLKALQIDNGEGCVAPSVETIANGTYQPLSRPLFIYVNTESLQRPEVQAYVNYYLSEEFTREIQTPEVGYVSLSPELYGVARQRVQQGTTGTEFEGGEREGTLDEIYGGQ